MHSSKEQKEKDKTLAQLHTDFSTVLNVLLHTAIDCLCAPDATLLAEKLLSGHPP